MNWIQEVPSPENLTRECLELEHYRFSENFNALLAEHHLSRIQVLNQLRRARYKSKYDYKKGNEGIYCFCLIASKTVDEASLSFFVSFESGRGGSVMLWIQEFHP